MEKQAETQKNIQIGVQIPCEVYSRIVGYLRPVQNWNHGKKQEFKERKTFVIKENTQQK